jgi:hypothetical protein
MGRPMTEPLLSYGPTDMHDDELRIAKGYKPDFWFYAMRLLTVGAVAYFFDVKWVIAVGILILVESIQGLADRLYDLCIRARRTNVLLRERNSN